jgi:hypothetical protein
MDTGLESIFRAKGLLFNYKRIYPSMIENIRMKRLDPHPPGSISKFQFIEKESINLNIGRRLSSI